MPFWNRNKTGNPNPGGETESAPSSGPVQQQEAPKPINDVERIVAAAPSIITEVHKTEAQLKEEAVHTRDLMEAARMDKGPFCITIGQGEARAVLLVASSLNRRSVNEVNTYNGQPYTSSGTFHDYVLLTPEGPRHASFQVEANSGSDADYLKKNVDKQNRLEQLIQRAIREGRTELPHSSYRETSYNGSTQRSLNIQWDRDTPEQEAINIHDEISPTNKHRESLAAVGVIKDETTVVQAVRGSLQMVQAPLQARLQDVRAQIGVVSAAAEAVK